ncbi:MAG TPA: MliC family protein [Rectinemataceae bacterium]|nr:MliC family protein [Rectinemataceae bacterium]
MMKPVSAFRLAASLLAFASLAVLAAPRLGAEGFRGEYVGRDFPGSRLSVGADSVRLSEGEGSGSVSIEGKIVSRSKEGFLVAWRSADPNAFKRSRFEAEYSGSSPVALRENPEGGLPSSVRPVYVPAGVYRPESFAFRAADGEKLVVIYDMPAATALVWLPDGRVFRLPAARSGSGARYSDGRRTYWEHQGGAVFLIGETVVFEGKLQRGDKPAAR